MTCGRAAGWWKVVSHSDGDPTQFPRTLLSDHQGKGQTARKDWGHIAILLGPPHPGLWFLLPTSLLIMQNAFKATSGDHTMLGEQLGLLPLSQRPWEPPLV